MLDACWKTGDERVVREIVSSYPDSVGFVIGKVDFLLFFVTLFVYYICEVMNINNHVDKLILYLF